MKCVWPEGLRGFGPRVFLLALAVRLGFLALWLFLGLDGLYGRDIYYPLALGWLGWDRLEGMDATHPPLYTAFIAAVLWCFRGPHPLPVLLVQVFLSSLAPVFVQRLGEKIGTPRVGRLAALWTALDPALVFFTPQLQSETLFVFMELLFFVRLYRCLEPGVRPWPWLGLGIWGGLCALCRSVFAAYPVALCPWLFWSLGWRRAWLPFALFSVGWLSPIAVWTARNWVRYHEIIPISAQMGWTLYEGFSLDREEIRRRPYEMGAEARRAGIPGSDFVAMGRYFKSKTMRFIRENPGPAARIVLGKALLYWRPWPYDPHGFGTRFGLGLYYSALFILALLGAWASRARFVEWGPAYVLIAYLTATHAVFFTSLRYRLPLEPLLILLASAGWEAWASRGEGRA